MVTYDPVKLHISTVHAFEFLCAQHNVQFTAYPDDYAYYSLDKRFRYYSLCGPIEGMDIVVSQFGDPYIYQYEFEAYEANLREFVKKPFFGKLRKKLIFVLIGIILSAIALALSAHHIRFFVTGMLQTTTRYITMRGNDNQGSIVYDTLIKEPVLEVKESEAPITTILNNEYGMYNNELQAYFMDKPNSMRKIVAKLLLNG